ncbi:MAG TPA: DUF2252 domain-containing protein [Candidatus Baltobacteraceae bacterium]|nr:DUF2252 domain-containing protein [Candidatus Baltobacteraceae bacterium]
MNAASFAAGRAARERVPRSAHREAVLAANRDPIKVISEQNRERIPYLIPLRDERMSRSPFAFFRGTAAIMAADLAETPVSGRLVQACGDCHLANFGLFATPERNVIFDLNDFDETLPAPWEWDVKRLATSTVLAALEVGGSGRDARRIALHTVQAYREHMRRLADASPLQIWFTRVDANVFLAVLDAEQAGKIERKQREAATRGEHIPPTFVTSASGKLRFVENPPILHHLAHNDPFRNRAREALRKYSATLRGDIRVLFERYHLRDAALRVVGIGSVGTHCAIALFQAGPNDALVLQIKEANASVLEPYAGASVYENHGERVVSGQRLMQAASDLFLGWLRLEGGQHYFVRRYRDRKAAANLERLGLRQLDQYAALCGTTLALAHARSGDPSFIAGYLGTSDKFDRALADYAMQYAANTEADYRLFVSSIAGRT